MMEQRLVVIVNDVCIAKDKSLSQSSLSSSLSSPTLFVKEGISGTKDDSSKPVRDSHSINDENENGNGTNTVNKKRKIRCCDKEYVTSNSDDSSFVPALTVEDGVVSINDDSDHDHDVDGDIDVDDKEGEAELVSETDCSRGIDSDCELQPKTKKLKKSYPSDLIVVLDMDECLIHLETQEQYQEQHEEEQQDSYQEQQQDKWGFSACSTENNDENKDGMEFMYVNENKIFLRPGLIDFLKFVTTRFETHIFTAGTKEYADSILDQLCLLVDNTEAFSKRWYREDCETIDIWDPCTTFHLDRTYVKPLSKVAEWAGRDAADLRRIVHVDDRVQNFLLNYDNGIQVSGWRGDDPDDEDLSKVTKVLREMDDHNSVVDVRPHLRKAFSESYLELKGQLDMMHFFAYRRKKGIDSQLFGE
eukprot:CAMPEP_0168170692 /NCGR_PEP_ID=MMETSP0139_2-20121125/4320_1 /TAXON_ID=44445 /ORGANISM="Pseudo-nitzschia australis, Strain 10249 10 AB" /LENGTH=416 /DNA_ID=CAMNT_0008088221 /DNA_START=104 /DNA_END=1354 /DNA_ORIENTATION=-